MNGKSLKDQAKELFRDLVERNLDKLVWFVIPFLLLLLCIVQLLFLIYRNR